MKGKEAVCMLCLVFITKRVLTSPVLWRPSMQNGGSKNHSIKVILRDGVPHEYSNELLSDSSSTNKDDKQLLEDSSASSDDKNQLLEDSSGANDENSQQLNEANSASGDNTQLSDSNGSENKNNLETTDGATASDENNSQESDYSNDGNRGSEERRLKIGDYVSPQDFLAVSEKLINKVENPGDGKGIVSSSKNAKILSEKLFKSFFRVPNRLAIVKENDLAGIDALQALALSGEEVTSLEDNFDDLNSKGQEINTDNESKYNVMKKKLENPVSDSSSEDDQKGNIHKLNQKKNQKKTEKIKKRTCYWNYLCKDKNNIDTCKLKSYCRIPSKPKSPKSYRRGIKSGLECRWSYKCTNDIDLTTCHLVPKCTPKKTSVHEIYLPHREDEQSPQMKSFRKMLGISLIDEEVEKILERRILQESGLGAKHKIESLSEYFHNLLEAEYKAVTKPMSYDTGTGSEKDIFLDDVSLESESKDDNQQDVTAESESQDEKAQIKEEDEDNETENEEHNTSTINESS